MPAASTHRTSVLLELDVTGQLCRVREDAVVPDNAVVRDVNVIHQQHRVADLRQHPAAFGAAMNRDELADLVVVADLDARRLAPILKILGSRADSGELKNPVTLAD